MSEVVEKSYAEQIAEKNKRKKIIISSISLGLVFIIALTVILLATIKVDLRPSVIENPSAIYFNGNSSIQYDKSDEEYKEFMNKYNEAFRVSILTGLFSNNLKDYEIVETRDSSSQSLPTSVTSGNYVTFLYKSGNVTLVKKDGKTYYSIYNSNNSIDFYQVSFALSSEDSIKDMSMYLKYKTGVTERYVEVKLKGNTFNLNEYYESIN